MRNNAVQKLESEIEEGDRREMQPPSNLGALPEFYEKLPEEMRQSTVKE
jgi:hypothetical protein